MADPIDYEKLAAAISKGVNANRSAPVTSQAGGTFGSPADLAGGLTLLTNGVSGMVKVVSDTVNVWQQASALGVGFSNDAVGLRSAIGVTRLGVDEYFEVVNRTKQGFTSLGGSLSDSTKVFSRLSQAFSDSAAADELRAAGFTTKEFNEVLALSVNGQRIRNVEDKQVQANVAASARELALEMDKVAQLTGVSRREQMDALQEAQKNARVQATLQDMLANGGKSVKDSYDQMKVSLTGLGLGKLGDEIFTGQAKTKESIAQIAALGPAATQLQNAIAAVRSAATEPERRAAMLLLDQAKAAVTTRTQEQSFRSLVRVGEGEVADAARNISISTRNFSEAIKSTQDEYTAATGKSLTAEEAEALAARRTNLRQQGLELDLKTDETRAIMGAKTTELAVQTAARISDAGVVLYESLNAVNEMLGKSPIVKQALDATANIKTDEKTGETTAFAQRFGRESLQRIPSEIEAGTLTENLPKILTAGAKEISDLLSTTGLDFSKTILNSATTFGQELWNGVKDWWTTLGGNQTRHTGTLGMTGKLFEEKDFFGTVAKGETVLTPQQLENLVKGVQDSSKVVIPTEFTSLLQAIQVELNTPTKDPGNIDLFSNIFKDIQTSISAANAPSKNPISEVATLMSDQSRKMESLMTSGFASMNMPADNIEVTPTINVEDIMAGIFRDFQSENVRVSDTIKSSFNDLSRVVPANQPQTQTSELSKIIPNEIKQARVEEQRQEQVRRRDDTLANQPAERVNDPTSTFNTSSATLDDVKELLVQLNTTMGSTVGQLSNLVATSERQVRATKRMDPNVATR